jgi:hypothetical protein
MNRIDFFTNEESEMMDLITFSNNVALLGSQNNPKMLFTSDYDFMEILTPQMMTTKKIVELFQQKIRQIRNRENVYLGDVKAGKLKGEKLRWNAEEILKGFKIFENQKITLEKAINQTDAGFKIDMIFFLDISGQYHEVSNVIERKKPPESNISNVRKELLKEVQEKKEEGKVYKSIKRIYSYLSTFKTGKEQQKKELLTIINNPVLGSLHQINEGLNTLIFLLDNNKISVRNVYFKRELEGFKQWLWLTFRGLENIKVILDELKDIIRNPSAEDIKSYQQKIAVILNENTKQLLKLHYK